jgi:hypothetical protein
MYMRVYYKLIHVCITSGSVSEVQINIILLSESKDWRSVLHRGNKHLKALKEVQIDKLNLLISMLRARPGPNIRE